MSPVNAALPSGGKLVETSGIWTTAMWAWMRNLTAAITTGGGPAPVDAQYIVGAADATLTAERVATSSATVTVDLSVPGIVTWIAAGATLFVAQVTLTNAQILTLPTVNPGLAAAPGAGKRIQPLAIDLNGDFTAGAYANVDPDAYLFGGVGISNEVFTNFLANDSTIPFTDLSTFLSAQHSRTALVPFTGAEPVSAWGNLASVGTLSAGAINQPLYLIVSNAAAGNFTGGHAANTLVVTSAYFVVN